MPSRKAADRRAGGKPRSLVEQAERSGDARRRQLALDVRSAGGISAYARRHGLPRTTVQGALALNVSSRGRAFEPVFGTEERPIHRVTVVLVYMGPREHEHYEAGDDLPPRHSPEEEEHLAEVIQYRGQDLPTLDEVREQLDGLAANTQTEMLVDLDAGHAYRGAQQGRPSPKMRQPAVADLVGYRIYLAPEARGRELVTPEPIEVRWQEPGPVMAGVIEGYEE